MYQFKKRNVLFVTLILIAALSVSCSSARVVDYNRSELENFTSYRCYSIIKADLNEFSDEPIMSSILSERIAHNLDKVLRKQGYSQNCENKDFLVTYSIITKTHRSLYDSRTTVSSASFPYQTIVGSVSYAEFEEGTLIVDIIDAEKNSLVWRGSCATVLGRLAPGDDIIYRMLTEIFALFPPVK